MHLPAAIFFAPLEAAAAASAAARCKEEEVEEEGKQETRGTFAFLASAQVAFASTFAVDDDDDDDDFWVPRSKCELLLDS